MNTQFKEDPLRELAKSYYWQSMYNRAKDLHGVIELFENKRDFSLIQLLFLQYLEQISGLYHDYYMGEKLLCVETINDEIRANAYLFYKEKNKGDKQIQTHINESKDRLVSIPRRKAVK
jgi:hypothetical protein